jgi:uncharacterized protein (TIGR02118 family)
MVKMVIFFKRAPGLTVEAFQRHWRDAHARLVEKLPGLRRYVQNHTLAETYRKGEPAFDAVAESSFDDTQAMKALVGTVEYAAVSADEPNFIDAASLGSIITEEHLVKDGSAAGDAVKSINFVSRKADMPVGEFFRYWVDVHGPLCRAAPSLRRYAQNHTRLSAYASGRNPAYDGVAMSWFDSMEALRAASGSGELAPLAANVARFVDAKNARQVLATEHVVVA